MTIVVLAIIVGISVGIYYYTSKEAPTEDVLDGDKRVGEMANKFDYSGVLADVTDGKNVLGDINTKGASSGIAQVTYVDEKYNLVATFEDLPDPVGTDFYEGWVVRQGIRFNVVSTGPAQKKGDVYVNEFQSEVDLTDHSRYVLTLEPDDGDTAPAEDHILEGVLEK